MPQFQNQAVHLVYLVGKKGTGGPANDSELNVINSRISGQTSRLLYEIHVGPTKTHLDSCGQPGLPPVFFPDHPIDIRQHLLEFSCIRGTMKPVVHLVVACIQIHCQE